MSQKTAMTVQARAAETGLARANLPDGPTMVLYRPGADEGHIATVGGESFTDLPALLHACAGCADRIQPGIRVELTEAVLLSPAGQPAKILCVGQNYSAHVKEGGRTSLPAYPDLFPKWSNALADPYADLPLPPESDQIDYESELVIVIGRRCRRIAASEVAEVVFGYTIANDGSVRDYQFHTPGRIAGKAWDGLTPLGPVVVPAGQVGGIRPDLRITGLLNDRVVQDDRTSSMIFGVTELVSYITTFLTLEPGDLILTGTPAGVGAVQKPPRYLADGDEFEVRIEGLGALRTRYSAEKRR